MEYKYVPVTATSYIMFPENILVNTCQDVLVNGARKSRRGGPWMIFQMGMLYDGIGKE